MSLYPVAGSKIFIGNRVSPKSGDVTLEDFDGANWVEIDGWANAGAIGDTQEILEQVLINQRRVRKIKGTLNGGTMENQFVPLGLDAGQQKYRVAIKDCQPYQFKIEWGADCVPEGDVTFSATGPATVTWNGHGQLAGQPVVFSTDGGTMPAGITADKVYFILETGLTANSFQIAETVGGTPVETTTAGTGPIIAVAAPAGMTTMFLGLATDGARQGGAASTIQLINWPIAVDSNILDV